MSERDDVDRTATAPGDAARAPDVETLAARHAALAAEVAERQRELAATEALLVEASAQRSRPLLDNLKIASPCHVAWDDMDGGDRVRHCAKCNKDVFDLSALTRDEAEALLRERAGNLCVSNYQRADGTVITSDCTVGIAKRRRRRVMAAGLAAMLASAGGLALFLSRRSHDTLAPTHPTSEMRAAGGVVAVPRPIEQPVLRAGGAAPVRIERMPLRAAGAPPRGTSNELSRRR